MINNNIIYQINNNEPIYYNSKTQQLVFKRIGNNYYPFPSNEPAINLILSDPPNIVQNIIIPKENYELERFNDDDKEIINYILTHFYNFYYDEERKIYCNNRFFKDCYNINVNVIVSLKDAIRYFEYKTFQRFIDRY